MVNLNFFFWNFLILFTYTYIELFCALLLISANQNLKIFTINFSKKLNYFIFKDNFFYIFLNLILLYLVTLKISFVDNNILSILLVYIFISKLMRTYLTYNVMFLNFNIFFFLFFILFINSLVIFFLFIELYSILFYFFFLNTNRNNLNLNLLKLKNSLLLYLINNFFTTILFLLGINYVVELYGSTNFIELLYLNNTVSSWKIYLIIFAFIVKLSLPSFHYLKLEIYKYLNIDIVVVFSVITIFLNFMFTVFFFSHNFVYNALVYYKFINLLLLLSFFFFIQKLKVNNFQEFIAYSGFATNNLIILNFLI